MPELAPTAFIVDRAVQELMDGGVGLEKDLWYKPQNGQDITPGM